MCSLCMATADPQFGAFYAALIQGAKNTDIQQFHPVSFFFVHAAQPEVHLLTGFIWSCSSK